VVGAISTSSNTRSAHAAVKGYEYQFDRTVIELLAAKPADLVEIEGIEDIDLHSAGQSCGSQIKYYESQKYTSPKSLRDPVLLMLEHFRTGARWNYVLHVHFGVPGELPTAFSLDEMKTCLTKEERKSKTVIEYFAGIDDELLQDFCDRVAIRSGDSFDEQQNTLVDELAKALNCSTDEVLAIYIAKARDFVHEKARSADSATRKVTRANLLEFLDVREMLFDRWHLEKLGELKYVAAQVALLKRGEFNDPKRLRGLSVELTGSNYQALMDITTSAASTYVGKLKNAKPWTIIVDCDEELLTKFKIELIQNATAFNDGLEAIQFSTDALSRMPVVNLIGASDKIKEASYTVRVVSESNFRKHLNGGARLGRLLVAKRMEDWHVGAADQMYELKNYEPELLSALVGGVI
jgi:hypothetical protein